jgi:hypothetical protein
MWDDSLAVIICFGGQSKTMRLIYVWESASSGLLPGCQMARVWLRLARIKRYKSGSYPRTCFSFDFKTLQNQPFFLEYEQSIDSACTHPYTLHLDEVGLLLP